MAVAGNSLESPRLLLNSESARFPQGLANSSGQVGRNYMRHTTGSVYAVFYKWGQTHDIKNLFVSDGSQFTTGAACNPTLTIVALAIRQADAMAGMMSRNEI